MRTKQEIQQILEKVLKEVSADEAQVSFGCGRGLATRFGENAITQNLSKSSEGLSIYVANGLRHGSSSTNKLDDDSICSMVKRAEDIAANSPEDPEAMPVLGPQDYPDLPPCFDPDTAALSPEDLARDVAAAVDMAKEAGYVTSGITNAGHSLSAMVTSKGLFAMSEGSHQSFSCTMHGAAGSGSQSGSDFRTSRLDAAAIAREALDTAIAAQNPTDIEPGDYTVIFEPEAVQSLLDYIVWTANARSADEGTTPFAGELGNQLFSDQLTVRTVIDDLDHPGSPYGSDGLPSRPQTWIENGVVKRLFHSRYWAKEKGETPDPNLHPIHVSGGEGSTADLIANCGRGLLVKHLWYIRHVDSRQLLLTGMTRDGLFLVENGKIVGPVKNLRFNESPMVFFKNIVARSAPKRLGGNLIPAITGSDFTFSSKTESV